MLVTSASLPSASAASRVCPVLLAASISSGSAHMEVYSSAVCSAGLLRLGQGFLIPAKPVAEDGGRPLRPLDCDALARSPGSRDHGLDQRGGLGFCSPEPEAPRPTEAMITAARAA